MPYYSDKGGKRENPLLAALLRGRGSGAQPDRLPLTQPELTQALKATSRGLCDIFGVDGSEAPALTNTDEALIEWATWIDGKVGITKVNQQLKTLGLKAKNETKIAKLARLVKVSIGIETE